ncbi:hypothetical protein ACOSP7_013600 [Xanthoceras sorbifolium]
MMMMFQCSRIKFHALKAYSKMWWRVVPCTSRRRNMRTESRKDIEEILKTKLATIEEEPPEMCDSESTVSLSSSPPPAAATKAQHSFAKKRKTKFGSDWWWPNSASKTSLYQIFITGY